MCLTDVVLQQVWLNEKCQSRKYIGLYHKNFGTKMMKLIHIRKNEVNSNLANENDIKKKILLYNHV